MTLVIWQFQMFRICVTYLFLGFHGSPCDHRSSDACTCVVFMPQVARITSCISHILIWASMAARASTAAHSRFTHKMIWATLSGCVSLSHRMPAVARAALSGMGRCSHLMPAAAHTWVSHNTFACNRPTDIVCRPIYLNLCCRPTDIVLSAH